MNITTHLFGWLVSTHTHCMQQKKISRFFLRLIVDSVDVQFEFITMPHNFRLVQRLNSLTINFIGPVTSAERVGSALLRLRASSISS